MVTVFDGTKAGGYGNARVPCGDGMTQACWLWIALVVWCDQ